MSCNYSISGHTQMQQPYSAHLIFAANLNIIYILELGASSYAWVQLNNLKQWGARKAENRSCTVKSEANREWKVFKNKCKKQSLKKGRAQVKFEIIPGMIASDLSETNCMVTTARLTRFLRYFHLQKSVMKKWIP